MSLAASNRPRGKFRKGSRLFVSKILIYLQSTPNILSGCFLKCSMHQFRRNTLAEFLIKFGARKPIFFDCMPILLGVEGLRPHILNSL